MDWVSFQSFAYQIKESNDSTFLRAPFDGSSSRSPKLAIKIH